MKDYKRLTARRETPLVMSMWAGDSESLKIYNRLAELEDKIESGELLSLKTSAEMAREACDILRNIKDDEIKRICKERDDFARRAEVAERALSWLCDETMARALIIMAERVLEYAQKAKVTAMTSDGLFSCDKDAQLALLVNDALRKAEQLAEKEKEGKQ